MTATGSHLSNVWAKTTDLQVVSGRGCRVVDVTGTEYLDFTAGIAAASTGHSHPKVVQAIADQAARFIHAQQNVYTHDLLEPLAARLAGVTPEPIDTFFFGSSSDEIIETAVKVAKHATGRHSVIAFDGAFHGRTHLTLAMSTARAIDRAGYGPFPPGIYVAPFPNPHASDLEAEVSSALRGLDRILQTQVAPSEVAAIIIEPVISERGYIPTPKAFMEGLATRCKEHGILFIADETQSGFGRTGRMFGIESHDVEPDMMVIAKGLASGFPIAALGMRRSIDDAWRKGSQGGSANGNPIGCAAALATLDIVTAPGFLDNVHARGQQLIDALREMQQLDPSLEFVRGRGLMIATEFDSPDRAEAVLHHCLHENRLILMRAGTRNRTIRWMPPLVVTSDEINEATSAFAAAIRATS